MIERRLNKTGVILPVSVGAVVLALAAFSASHKNLDNFDESQALPATPQTQPLNPFQPSLPTFQGPKLMHDHFKGIGDSIKGLPVFSPRKGENKSKIFVSQLANTDEEIGIVYSYDLNRGLKQDKGVTDKNIGMGYLVSEYDKAGGALYGGITTELIQFKHDTGRITKMGYEHEIGNKSDLLHNSKLSRNLQFRVLASKILTNNSYGVKLEVHPLNANVPRNQPPPKKPLPGNPMPIPDMQTNADPVYV
jgi:hypothetical protein